MTTQELKQHILEMLYNHMESYETELETTTDSERKSYIEAQLTEADELIDIIEGDQK